MSFMDTLLGLLSGARAETRGPTRRGRTTHHKRQKSKAKITNRRTVTVHAYGEKDTNKYAKVDGEWNYWYDRQWIPMSSLPAGELKSALAAKGVS